jgi:uncharacterized protein YqeY
MLRQDLSDALKKAVLAKDSRTVSTLRLILAGLKDRDIAARPKGITDGIGEDEILQLLQSLVKQRRESIAMYAKGGRQDLVDQETEEIAIIERFLPAQMPESEAADVVTKLIAEIGAKDIKDMGRVMAALKERYAGRMDFAKVSGLVRQRLG